MPIIIPALVVIFLIVFLTLVPIGLWITARSSGVPVSMGSLVAMRFRRINLIKQEFKFQVLIWKVIFYQEEM